MSKKKTITFANQFAMRCPKCKESNSIDVDAILSVRLMPDGTDADQAGNGDHTWDSMAFCRCAGCGFMGTVADFYTYQCANCLKVFNADKIKTDIPDYHERVAPGEIAPAGECLKCGALVHLLEDTEAVEQP